MVRKCMHKPMNYYVIEKEDAVAIYLEFLECKKQSYIRFVTSFEN